MKNTLLALCIALVLAVISAIGSVPGARSEMVAWFERTIDPVTNAAAVFFVPGVSVANLQEKYEAPVSSASPASSVSSVSHSQKPIKILLMPGHEPNYGGAEYRNLKEREMTVQLVDELASMLRKDPHFEIVVPRSEDAWSPTFQDYFKNNWASIISFTKNQHAEMNRLVSEGKIKKSRAGVFHNTAPTDVALRIYGINKWANENGVDLAIHVHFNDYPRKNDSGPGDYSGFTIYVPEHSYSNSSTTKVIADALFGRLSTFYATSNLPKESDGIVEEQDLIAIGSGNTVDAPSMLIEYGYIYEPLFQDKTARSLTISDMAYQTYLGIEDFFGQVDINRTRTGSSIFPYSWGDFSKDSIKDVFALQTAFILDKDFPATGMTKNNCQRSGGFGKCTLASLAQFQKKYGITGESGKVGPATIAKLKELF